MGDFAGHRPRAGIRSGMRYLLLPLILLTGCSQAPRQLNPGAIVPIYAVDPAELQAMAPGLDRPHGMLWRGVDGSVTVWLTPRALNKNTARLAIHEFCHLAEHDFPGVWQVAEQLDAPGFPVMRHANTR